ncbi:hypothetical protein U0070_020249 [Myodes glareolus]|uniref:Uncharacterized protein n=1 Tax=Myodes glareolus TaxID=447135 RepID=A0AAW0JDZ2_MYOGA
MLRRHGMCFSGIHFNGISFDEHTQEIILLPSSLCLRYSILRLSSSTHGLRHCGATAFETRHSWTDGRSGTGEFLEGLQGCIIVDTPSFAFLTCMVPETAHRTPKNPGIACLRCREEEEEEGPSPSSGYGHSWMGVLEDRVKLQKTGMGC